MSHTIPHTTTFTVPPDTAHRTFPLEISGLGHKAHGWVWYRPRPTWIEPQHLPSLDRLKDLTVHMLLLRNGTEYLCILPVSSETALAHVSRRDGSDGHGLMLHVRGASHTQRGRAALVVTRTYSERHLARLAAAAVRAGRNWIQQEPPAYQPMASGPLAGVGFCTWNALEEGRNVNEHSIRYLVETLLRARLPIQTFIIDDGWQDIRHFRDSPHEHDRRRGLWSFKAKPEIGPGGMRGVAQMIKERLETVDSVGTTNVGAWLTLTGGYWDGVHPASPLVAQYGCRKYPASRRFWRGCPEDPLEPNHMPSGSSFYILPPPERAVEFWSDWFTELRNAGITFLKVDNQAAMTALEGVDGVAQCLAIWEAMFAVAAEIFGTGRVIHCMSHNEAVWAGPHGLGLTSDGQRFVWRNSDDFGLTGRSPSAHQQHLFVNLMNALVSNALCAVPDADMFMTTKQHPHAHALLRALFPGPLLLTDKPGEHDPSLFWRLVARDKQGTAAVLRPRCAAQPLSGRLLDTSILDYEDGTGLWAAVAVGGITILAVWNVRGGYDKPCVVNDVLTVGDVEDALGHELEDDYVVARMGVETAGVHGASLVPRGRTDLVAHIDGLSMLAAASFWIRQVLRLPVGRMVVLGLVNHFAGPAGLHGVAVWKDTVHVQLVYGGKLGVLVETTDEPRAHARVDGRPMGVQVMKVPSLAGEAQHMFLLTVDVWHIRRKTDSGDALWNVYLTVQ